MATHVEDADDEGHDGKRLRAGGGQDDTREDDHGGQERERERAGCSEQACAHTQGLMQSGVQQGKISDLPKFAPRAEKHAATGTHPETGKVQVVIDVWLLPKMHGLEEFECSRPLNVLGTWMQCNGKHDAEFRAVVKRTWAAFHSKAHLWRAQGASSNRVKALHLAFFPGMSWTAGT